MANFSISYIYQIKDKMSPTLTKINEKIKQQTQELKKNQLSWSKITAEAKNYAGAITKATVRLDKFNNKLLDSTGSLIALGAGISSLALPIKKAMDFESAMVGIAKATDLTAGTKPYEDMKNQIKQLSREIPIATNELAEMAAAGGRLGIATDKLPDFVRLTAKTSIAFDMMGEEASDVLADISAKMSIPISSMENMVGAINAVENNFSAKGNRIIRVIARISGEAKFLNLSEEQTAGLAGFASQIETSEELAASGLQMMINRMYADPKLKKALIANPMKAIDDLLKKYKGMDKDALQTAVIKTFGVESGRFVKKAVGNYDLFKKTLDTVADSQKNVKELTDEYIKQIGTTAARAQLASNAFNNIAAAIGDALLPATAYGLNAFKKLGESLEEFIKNNHLLVQIIAVVIASFVGLIAVAKIWQLADVALTGATLLGNAALKGKNLLLATGTIAMKAYSVAMTFARNAQTMFNAAMLANPIGMLIAGVAALAAGLAAIVIYWDDIAEAIGNAIDLGLQFVSSIFCGDEEFSNVAPKLSGAEASRGASAPSGNVNIGVTGTNAQVTSMDISGQGLNSTGMVKFAEYMNI